MLTRELIARLPKAELHTHLDAALRPETMIELAGRTSFELPTRDPLQQSLDLARCVEHAHDLPDDLQRPVGERTGHAPAQAREARVHFGARGVVIFVISYLHVVRRVVR